MKENTTVTTNENEVVEEVKEVKESKVKNALTKAGGFVKKHGKKIAVGTLAVIGTGLLAYKALKKGDNAEDYDYDGDYDDDALEVESEESEE